MAKPTTTYTPVAKIPTSYDLTQGSVTSWLLNSTLVTLNSIVYLLSGYTTNTPNQSSNKPKTTYTTV